MIYTCTSSRWDRHMYTYYLQLKDTNLCSRDSDLATAVDGQFRYAHVLLFSFGAHHLSMVLSCSSAT